MAKKKKSYTSSLTWALRSVPADKLSDIHRFAKRPGLRPFFRDPRDMVELRNIVETSRSVGL